MTTLGRTAPCAPTAAVPRCAVNDAGRVFLELLCATVALGAYRSVLAEVLALAVEAPGLSDEQLRDRLVGLDDRGRPAQRDLVGHLAPDRPATPPQGTAWPTYPRPKHEQGQERPVKNLARWARSPLDYHAHLLLPEGEHPSGVLQARCGDLMITGLTQHDQPPPGLRCERCHLIFLADASAR
ncbi:MAG: hypothetical protein ACRDRW_08485 [Pseudonocardiaceae bacterium]